MFSAALPGLIVASNADESLLQSLHTLSAAMATCAGRVFWGIMSDLIGFKRTHTTLMLVQAILLLNYRTLAALPFPLAAHKVGLAFCVSGLFATFPAHVYHRFGVGGAPQYAMLFSAFGCCALLSPALGSFIQLQSSANRSFYRILALIAILSGAITTTMRTDSRAQRSE